MPQPTKGPRLGGSPDHQRLMLANLATSLFTHGKIHTTRAKAERLRPYAERLITKARQGDLHSRRLISKQIRDKDVVHRLIAEIGPFFADRPGGYTRIVKTLPRKGDNAPMAIIELVNERTASAEASQATRVASQQSGTSGAAATGTGAAAAEATSEGADTSSPEVPEATASAEATTEAVTESESGETVASTETEPEGGSSVTLENDAPESTGRR